MDLEITEITQGQNNLYVIKMTTQIETTFMLGDKAITIQHTKKPKYCLTIDNQKFELCTAQQVRASVNSIPGLFISLNGVYMELMGRKRGFNKQKKLDGVTITRIVPTQTQAP